jgi:hypothetical protein
MPSLVFSSLMSVKVLMVCHMRFAMVGLAVAGDGLWWFYNNRKRLPTTANNGKL